MEDFSNEVGNAMSKFAAAAAKKEAFTELETKSLALGSLPRRFRLASTVDLPAPSKPTTSIVAFRVGASL